jgi:hypothetical protein
VLLTASASAARWLPTVKRATAGGQDGVAAIAVRTE